MESSETFFRTVVLAAVFIVAAACRRTTAHHMQNEDHFAPGALASYSAYSDDGMPWSIVPGTLEGNGFGLQSVLIRNYSDITDGWVEVTADSVDDGGIVLRFSDNEHYYLLAIRDDLAPFPRGQDNLQIYRRGGWGQAGFVSLWRANVWWPRGVEHHIRFEAQGDSLRVFFDELKVGAIRDKSVGLGGSGWGVRHYGASRRWMSRYRGLTWHSVD